MFDWLNYLDLAGKLVGEAEVEPSDESKARTSISRSYYCAYHLACELLLLEGDTNIGKSLPDSHRYVIDQFHNRNNRKFINMGDILLRLKNDRISADYWKDKVIEIEKAKTVWKTSSWLTAQLKKEIRQLRAKRR